MVRVVQLQGHVSYTLVLELLSELAGYEMFVKRASC